MNSLDKAAGTALKKCMGLKRNESCLIIFDKNKKRIADAFFSEAKKTTKKAEKIEMSLIKVSGNEPPKNIAKKMLEFDVIMITTTKSITHTKATIKASKKGARIASMPGITEDIIKRTIDIDYEKIKKRAEKLKKILSKGTYLSIISNKGTEIKSFIKKRKIKFSLGLLNKKGKFGNLPGAEIFLPPPEGKTEGTAIIDASMANIGKLKNPIKINIKKGYATKIKGGKGAEKLKEILKSSGKNSRNIAEIGIGLNEKAKITGAVLEDEKVLGTVHIALGNNTSFGGKTYAKCHLDGIILNPTIYLDKKIIMKNGKLLI